MNAAKQFEPSAYLVGTESRPSQITIYGVTGGAERWLKIPLDLTQPPVTFAPQAHSHLRKTPLVPFFGPATGFIVNYSPSQAVRFDRDGHPVELLPSAYIPGQVIVELGGRKLAADEFGKILGFSAPPDRGPG